MADETYDSFDAYQNQAGTTRKYPVHSQPAALQYLVLGLNGEAGEVAEKLKKVLRDNPGQDILTQTQRDAMMRELGDVLWYTAEIATWLGYSLSVVAEVNVNKLQARAISGSIGGSGDHR